jgi:hypothetical protein
MHNTGRSWRETPIEGRSLKRLINETSKQQQNSLTTADSEKSESARTAVLSPLLCAFLILRKGRIKGITNWGGSELSTTKGIRSTVIDLEILSLTRRFSRNHVTRWGQCSSSSSNHRGIAATESMYIPRLTCPVVRLLNRHV